MTSLTDRMLSSNVDGASVHVGVHRGIDTQLMKNTLWLQVTHCFNHRVELALMKCCLDFTTCKLYHFRELQELSEAYDNLLLKPTKCN